MPSRPKPPSPLGRIGLMAVALLLTRHAAAEGALASESEAANRAVGIERGGAGDQSAPGYESSRGFRFGGGMGATGPVGAVATGTPFDHLVTAVPVGRVDVGYRFRELFLLGSYFEGGAGETIAGAQCGVEGVECSVALLRLGVEARLYPMRGTAVQPWLGVGVGHEWFSFRVLDEGVPTAVIIASGSEAARVGGGAEYRLAAGMVGGAYLSYSTGRYSKVDYHGDVEGGSAGQHHWIVFGVTFSLLL